MRNKYYKLKIKSREFYDRRFARSELKLRPSSGSIFNK